MRFNKHAKKNKQATTKLNLNPKNKLIILGIGLALVLITLLVLFKGNYQGEVSSAGEATAFSSRVWCEDSDRGANYLTKGTVKSNIHPNGKEDYCFTFPNWVIQNNHKA